jgi:hypothetical protein
MAVRRSSSAPRPPDRGQANRYYRIGVKRHTFLHPAIAILATDLCFRTPLQQIGTRILGIARGNGVYAYTAHQRMPA